LPHHYSRVGLQAALHAGSIRALTQTSLLFERTAETQCSTGQRIFGDTHRQPAGVAEHSVEIAEEGTAAGQHDTPVDDVRGELWDGFFQGRGNRIDDGVHRLGQAL